MNARVLVWIVGAALVTAAVMLVALALTLAVPETSYFPLLLLACDGPLLQGIRRRRRRLKE